MRDGAHALAASAKILGVVQRAAAVFRPPALHRATRGSRRANEQERQRKAKGFKSSSTGQATVEGQLLEHEGLPASNASARASVQLLNYALDRLLTTAESIALSAGLLPAGFGQGPSEKRAGRHALLALQDSGDGYLGSEATP